MNIKAIFFDLDGTLRHNLPGGGEIFSEHVRSLGLELSDDDLQRAMRWERKVLGQLQLPPPHCIGYRC